MPTISVHVSHDEARLVRERARSSRQSLSGYVRSKAVKEPAPPAANPPEASPAVAVGGLELVWNDALKMHIFKGAASFLPIGVDDVRRM